MTQLGGQAELIESRKERQISGAGNEERGGGRVDGQCNMIERSANVDEAAAAAATAASCSCTLGAALMSCSRMNQSSTAAATLTFPALPRACHIRQLVGCGGSGMVWLGEWRGVEL